MDRSHIDHFLSLGAQSVGGDFILKGQTLGRMRDGQFVLTEEGLAMLDVVEVSAKEVTTEPLQIEAAPAAEKPKRARKPKLGAPEAGAPASTDEVDVDPDFPDNDE